MIYGEPLNLGGGASGEGIPSGGTAGQVLKKASATDYDVRWEDQSSYTLPVATDSALGGVQPVSKTVAMTQRVGVDENGALWTAGGGSASPYVLDLTGTQIEMSMPTVSDPYRTYTWTVDTAIPSEMLAAAEAGRAILVKVEDTNADQSTFQVLPITIGNDPSAAVYVGGAPYSNLEFGTLQKGTIFRSNISFVVRQGTTTLTLVIGMVYGKVDFWTGTQAEYDALTTYDSGTTYYIVEASS